MIVERTRNQKRLEKAISQVQQTIHHVTKIQCVFRRFSTKQYLRRCGYPLADFPRSFLKERYQSSKSGKISNPSKFLSEQLIQRGSYELHQYRLVERKTLMQNMIEKYTIIRQVSIIYRTRYKIII
jgi:hypothetical protein